MKLSDAIREGAKKRPQAYGAFFNLVGSCALGAALEALGLRKDHLWLGVLTDAFPELRLKRNILCAACGAPMPTLQNAIIHLNDNHRWSREKIADWLDSDDGINSTCSPVTLQDPQGDLDGSSAMVEGITLDQIERAFLRKWLKPTESGRKFFRSQMDQREMVH